MLAIEEEEISKELRRELIVLLHLNREEYARLKSREELERVFDRLREVQGLLLAVSLEHAAVKLSIPPLLRSDRLRGVLKSCLAAFFGRDVGFSLRLPGELADTLEVSREMAEDWSGDGVAVLCFTDEGAVGEPDRSLAELRDLMSERIQESLTMTFPINYYDILCIWQGTVDSIVWGPDKLISAAYADLAQAPVSSTARSLEAVAALLTLFNTWAGRSSLPD